MDATDVRSTLESVRESESADHKDSQVVLERLRAVYRLLDAGERAHAQSVLVEWALAADETLRFDALTLIDEFAIVAAAPALTTLAARLATSQAAGACYELKKVNRILVGLAARSS
jgi:hypothetical protein